MVCGVSCTTTILSSRKRALKITLAMTCVSISLFLKRIQPMTNVPLAFVNVYQRMSDILHMLAYAGMVR